MYMLCFHVPETHLDIVKNALFAAGAGRMAHYSHCAWQVAGTGQFIPLEGNHAFIGKTDALEQIIEYKVETTCDDHVIRDVVAALKAAHPYEVPSYQAWRIEDF